MQLILSIFKRFFSLNSSSQYDDLSLDGRIQERQRRIKLTAITSGILKALTMGVPLITIKITYTYLNPEIYGLWSTVTTFFALFAFSDLGLGNGLQTRLSQAKGIDDLELCRKIISNTFITLGFISIFLIIFFFSTFWILDWVKLMNIKNTEAAKIAVSVIFIVVGPKLISIPFSVIQRTQFALQEGFISDVWSIIGYLFNLMFILIIVKLDLGKLTLLFATSFLPVLVLVLNMVVYFFFQRKEFKISVKLFDFKLSKSLLSLGIHFSILSVLTTIGLSMDTYIVAKTCNLSDAGSYSIMYRLSAMFSAIITIISTPLWGANGEALARGDFDWVRKNTRQMSLIMTFVTIFFVIIGLVLAPVFFDFWLGNSFKISFKVLFWLSISQILLSFISPYFMILNALGDVKVQIVLFSIYSPLSFVFKYYLSIKFGLEFIPIIGSLFYFLIIVFGVYFYVGKRLNSLEKIT